MTTTTWRAELANMLEDGELLIACTLTEEELDFEFDPGYGNATAASFTAWTKDWVYFDEEYDGTQHISCVARNPE